MREIERECIKIPQNRQHKKVTHFFISFFVGISCTSNEERKWKWKKKRTSFGTEKVGIVFFAHIYLHTYTQKNPFSLMSPVMKGKH